MPTDIWPKMTRCLQNRLSVYLLGRKSTRGGWSGFSSHFRRFRAQVASLQQARKQRVSNFYGANSEGALNEVSRLLADIRQRAVAAANTGVNDSMIIATQKN